MLNPKSTLFDKEPNLLAKHVEIIRIVVNLLLPADGNSEFEYIKTTVYSYQNNLCQSLVAIFMCSTNELVLVRYLKVSLPRIDNKKGYSYAKNCQFIERRRYGTNSKHYPKIIPDNVFRYGLKKHCNGE